MKFTTLPILITCSALVSACGGSSDPLTYDDYVDEAVALADQVTGQNVGATEISSLPTTGSARYIGVAGATMSDTTEVVGRITIDADFADNTVSGSISDLVDQDSNSFEGALEISDANIDRSGTIDDAAIFEGDLSGTLTNVEDEEFFVDAEIGGGFGGEDHEYVAGFFEGTATSGDDVLTFDDGDFLGEKQ